MTSNAILKMFSSGYATLLVIHSISFNISKLCALWSQKPPTALFLLIFFWYTLNTYQTCKWINYIWSPSSLTSKSKRVTETLTWMYNKIVKWNHLLSRSPTVCHTWVDIYAHWNNKIEIYYICTSFQPVYINFRDSIYSLYLTKIHIQ